ncbi:MAG: penicillin-binding protein activator, partial [Chitinivibrionales bacterium]|nr:penicillin-binding protein activator [Chitinivibrionales bacterium]
AQLGKYIFQLNVTPTMLAARIARYAVENLHIKEYAILAPLSDYGRIFSASFKNEVTKLGGLILDEEYFEEGTNDFKLQFENMRKKLTDLRWEKLAAEGASDKYSSPRYKDNFLADSTIEVGGLFIPATAEDASKIASQVYFHRIRTQLLGSNGWHAASILTDGKRYVENALISTGAEPDEKSELWVQFSKEYKIRFKEPADRVVAPLGFDAANLLFQAIANDDDAQAVGNYLHRVKGYRGVTGTITFENGGGVNTETAILKIGNKNFIQVQ